MATTVIIGDGGFIKTLDDLSVDSATKEKEILINKNIKITMADYKKA